MTELLPRLGGSFDESDRKTLDRRQLLRAGAWAAPVIVLATAAPAAANTSLNTTPTTGNANVDAAALAVNAYGLYDLNAGGSHGPLGWAGGQVGYWNAVNGVSVATFTWTVLLTRPDMTTTTVASGVANVAAGDSLTIPQQDVAQKPMMAGTYTLTLTVSGTGNSTKADVETKVI